MRTSVSAFSVITFLLQSLLVSATSSYISLRGKENNDNNRLSTTYDLISHSSKGEPVVVFEFQKFKLLAELTQTDNRYPYLDKFFDTGITTILNDEPILVKPSGKDKKESSFFIIKDLPASASELLYDADLENQKIVWLQFKNQMYDLSSLDEFMESVTIFLEEYVDVNIDIVINSRDTISMEEFDSEEPEDILDPYIYDQDEVDQETKNPDQNDTPDDVDNDILSDIWTEGLIMCLLISAFLLFILITALSWLSSLDISYGALEKSTTPLKKNQ